MKSQLTAHKNYIDMDINIVQSQPFDEIMLDELDDAVDISKTQSRLVSMPDEEERVIPFPIHPCHEQAPASVPLVASQFVDIESDYLVDPTVLGVGHHGSVRKCIHRETGRHYAVKSIYKSNPSVRMEMLAREIMMLKEIRHENIIQLVDVYEDEEYVHIVTELCQGGELFERIIEKSNGPGVGCFTEKDAARILYQILVAVSNMHRHNCVHRDLKPENILFETKEEGSPIKLIDLGLARKHYPELGEPPMSNVVGTPYYISPCVLKKKYDKSCDMWSIGVIAYILLAGYPPFNGDDNREVYAAVRKGTYYFPEGDWKHLSTGARKFVAALLQKDPRQRMTAKQALRHPWILKHTGMEESRDAIEVVYGRSPRKDSVSFKQCFGLV